MSAFAADRALDPVSLAAFPRSRARRGLGYPTMPERDGDTVRGRREGLHARPPVPAHPQGDLVRTIPSSHLLKLEAAH